MSQVIKKLMQFCQGRHFNDSFRKLFEKHAALFREGPKTYVQGEHNMEQWAAYQEYLGLYEELMSGFLETNDISMDEFMSEMKAHQGKGDNMQQKLLIDCLISAGDYEHFYRIAYREGMKVHLPCGNPRCVTCAIREGRPIPQPVVVNAAGAKADSKGGEEDGEEESGRKGGGESGDGRKAEGKNRGDEDEEEVRYAASKGVGGDDADIKGGSK